MKNVQSETAPSESSLEEEIDIQTLDDNDASEAEIVEEDGYTFQDVEADYVQEPLSQDIKQEDGIANDWQAEVAKALRNANGNKS